MKYAVFFRNLNLGRNNSPNRLEFEQAFADAGAKTPTSFLTNGTLVFSVANKTEARRVTAAACQQLESVCGCKEPAFVRPVKYLANLIESDPFVSFDRDSVFAFCISFFSAKRIPPLELPIHSKRGDVEVLQLTNGEALSISRKIGRSPGSPNSFLEKRLEMQVSTRNWNTILRLVKKFG